ncbi:MAG: hypothetical protein P1U86_03260 [Verrucomicrobiales bacterium]|nr:hypothetical protein [Verrucomicrobiales bacterium]
MPEFLNTVPAAIAIFLVSAAFIVVAGTRLAKIADQLADRTGLGEALTGVFLLGATTSLPGLVASVSAAVDGRASMAVSNAVGGIAVQTVFLVAADLFCRRANLEHAAASLTNLFQGILLMGLLSVALVAGIHPFAESWAIHPASLLLVVGFLVGQVVASRIREAPMWKPVRTAETREDVPDNDAKELSLSRLWIRFLSLAAITGLCGWFLALSGFVMVDQAGIEEGIVGALFTAIASSLPELITSIAAVRAGAYTLAVSGIIGGNAFDTLFLAAADLGFKEGSIYHAAGQDEMLMIGITLTMTSVVCCGLLARQKSGPGNIGWEGFLILGLYTLAIATKFL